MKWILFLTLLCMKGLAMKPAPFENVTYQSSATNYRLSSTMAKSNDGYGVDGKTEVTDPTGKKLWSMPKFIGRHSFQLSPDGKTLVLYGDFYFGTQLHMTGDPLMATVYTEGKELKRVYFSQLFGAKAEKIALERKLPIKGGNWGDLSDFVKNLSVDWNKRELNFKLHDEKTTTISYKGSR